MKIKHSTDLNDIIKLLKWGKIFIRDESTGTFFKYTKIFILIKNKNSLNT